MVIVPAAHPICAGRRALPHPGIDPSCTARQAWQVRESGWQVSRIIRCEMVSPHYRMRGARRIGFLGSWTFSGDRP